MITLENLLIEDEFEVSDMSYEDVMLDMSDALIELTQLELETHIYESVISVLKETDVDKMVQLESRVVDVIMKGVETIKNFLSAMPKEIQQYQI